MTARLSFLATAAVATSLGLVTAAAQTTTSVAGGHAPAPVVKAPVAVGPTAPPAPLEPGVYRIGPEDVLDINVWRNAELTRKVSVRPDGRISLPLLNDVQAANLTPLQLRD